MRRVPPHPVALAILLLFQLPGACRTAAAGNDIPEHPVVVGFDRFFASTNLAWGGELLLSELRCVNCHTPGPHAERFPVWPGPSLEGIATRVQFSWLVDWLESPHATKPGTIMPDVLPARDEGTRGETAEALAHFLFSLGGETPESPEETPPGSFERGRRLFHTAGCAACHAPDPSFTPAQAGDPIAMGPLEIPSAPLGDVRRKYARGGLIAFLQDPLGARPSGHMPRIPMTGAEAADLAVYLLGIHSGGREVVSLSAALIRQGREHFAGLGCVHCHSVPGQDLKPAKTPKPLSELARVHDQGCMLESTEPGMANYRLSAIQRQAIEAALGRIANPPPLTVAERIELRMTALNCYACHERDGRGGPEPGRAVYFETSGADLEDEGRIPPSLTVAGRKLTEPALVDAIRGRGPVRSYMTTRMPDFGAAEAEMLARLFAQADLTDDIEPTSREGQEHLVGRGPWGRELMGVTGLGCINCHDLNGAGSLGIRALDLASAPRRLRPEWFRDYLIDPAAFRPGTRMPSFWPEGRAVHPLIGHNTARQIDSIWAYLNEIDQSRLPEGMEKEGDFELQPVEAPIVFRTFMKEAGFQAIAVGFREQAHAAFDAGQVRWAIAWQGRFLDAEGTWSDRFAPLAEPLGTNVIGFPPGGLFWSSSEASKAHAYRPLEYRMGGYRLDSGGVPAFLYRAGDLEVEDRLEPAEPKGKALRRVVKIRGGTGGLWFHAAADEQVVPEPNGVWRAGRVRIRVIEPSPADAIVSKHNEQSHLLLPVVFDEGAAGIAVEIQW